MFGKHSIVQEDVRYLELFLQTVDLCSQGVDDVLPMFEHEALQLLRCFYQLYFLGKKLR